MILNVLKTSKQNVTKHVLETIRNFRPSKTQQDWKSIMSWNIASGWPGAKFFWGWQAPCHCQRGNGKSDDREASFNLHGACFADHGEMGNESYRVSIWNLKWLWNAWLTLTPQGLESCREVALQHLRTALKRRQQSNSLLTVACHPHSMYSISMLRYFAALWLCDVQIGSNWCSVVKMHL